MSSPSDLRFAWNRQVASPFEIVHALRMTSSSRHGLHRSAPLISSSESPRTIRSGYSSIDSLQCLVALLSDRPFDTSALIQRFRACSLLGHVQHLARTISRLSSSNGQQKRPWLGCAYRSPRFDRTLAPDTRHPSNRLCSDQT